VASKRLNTAALRQDEADSVLDISIALEALLVDDSAGEITYRLAMRMAALAGIDSFDDHPPEDVYALCKKVYDYRSAVIHGARNVEKKRLIRVGEHAQPIPALSAGLFLLRNTIRALVKHPEFLDPKRLDKHMIRPIHR
jgi:hypothetical protein